MKKIFITGCARSGTTLLCRLFYSFKGVEVWDDEMTIDNLKNICLLSSPNEIIVAKRAISTVFSEILPDEEINRQLALIKDHDIQIVNIVRNGRDVVHKPEYGTQAGCDRWIASMEQASKYKEHIAAQVYYEDVVCAPIITQQELAEKLDLSIAHEWTQYPQFVPQEAFEVPFVANKPPSYGARPIDSSSLCHDPVDQWRMHANNSEEEKQMEKWLNKYFNKDI